MCDVCPLRVQETEDTFYYKDCRTACAGDEGGLTNATVRPPTYIYICIYLHIYYIYVYLSIYFYIFLYIYMYIYIYIYIYMYIYR